MLHNFLYILFTSAEHGVPSSGTGPISRMVSEYWLGANGSHRYGEIAPAKIVEDVIESEFVARNPDIYACTKFATPPVAELIAKSAVKNRTSLLDAALTIRESDEATEYRRWLGQLQAHIQAPTRPAAMAAERQIKELKAVVKEWAKRSDMDYGIKYVDRTISLKSLPLGIGTLLDAAGMGELRLKDKKLSKAPGHLKFIASWYSD